MGSPLPQTTPFQKQISNSVWMKGERKMGETGVKNTGKKGINARNLSRATQKSTSRMQRNTSDAHVSSKISCIWHRGSIAPLTRIAIVLLFLRNKKGKCEAPASQGKIIKISSHPAVYQNQKLLLLHLSPSHCYSPMCVFDLGNKWNILMPCSIWGALNFFFIAEQVNRIKKNPVNAVSRKMNTKVLPAV